MSNLDNAKATVVKRNSGKQKSKSKKSKVSVDKGQLKHFLKKPIVLCAIFFLIVGLIGGYFAVNSLTKNDCFVMNAYFDGEVDIVIGSNTENETYIEQGVKCVSFNKDISSDVKIEYYYRKDLAEDYKLVTKVDENEAGIYYVVYTINNIKYKNVKLIRNVIVTKGED